MHITQNAKTMCSNDGNRNSEIAGGLEVPCFIRFKSQTQILSKFSRLQTNFKERTGACITVLNLK